MSNRNTSSIPKIILFSGETWGLYWSDYEDELRELIEENTEKYIKVTFINQQSRHLLNAFSPYYLQKHPDDKCKSRILVVTSHQCPVRPRSQSCNEDSSKVLGEGCWCWYWIHDFGATLEVNDRPIYMALCS